MQQLNLFGTPIGMDDSYRGKNRSAKKEFVNELVEIMDMMDEDIQNFEMPKRFIYFDPNSEDNGDNDDPQENSQLTAIKYEDSHKLRASIILDVYEQQLKGIDPKKLIKPEDQQRYERVKNLLSYLKNVKIIDAPVLLKIYNLYRCSL